MNKQNAVQLNILVKTKAKGFFQVDYIQYQDSPHRVG